MKQKYQKPTMRAIELQQRPTLLEGSEVSAVNAERRGYGEAKESDGTMQTWN